jgi:hypothetical protein
MFMVHAFSDPLLTKHKPCKTTYGMYKNIVEAILDMKIEKEEHYMILDTGSRECKCVFDTYSASKKI